MDYETCTIDLKIDGIKKMEWNLEWNTEYKVLKDEIEIE